MGLRAFGVGIGWAALVVLTACQNAVPPKVPQPPATPRITLLPDAEGLLVQPSGKRIDFGRAPSGVIPVLDREFGAHDVLPLTHCPADVTARHRWGTLELSFTDERFVGWRQWAELRGAELRGAEVQGQVCPVTSDQTVS